jgi:hypothetical protein
MSWVKSFDNALKAVGQNGKEEASSNDLKTALSAALWTLNDQDLARMILFTSSAAKLEVTLDQLERLKKKANEPSLDEIEKFVKAVLGDKRVQTEEDVDDLEAALRRRFGS